MPNWTSNFVKKGKWNVTDASCKQRCRIWTYDDGHKEYEYEQEIDGHKESEVINVADYINDLTAYLSPYGYKSLDDVKKIYGDKWEMIVAECIFETDFYEYVVLAR